MRLKAISELRKILLKELSACVKCGSCHVLCPLYKNFKTEFSGMRGKIAVLQAIEEGNKIPHADVAKILENCLGCLGCKASCPNSVNTDLIRFLWKFLAEGKPRNTEFTWTLSDSDFVPFPCRGRAHVLSEVEGCPTRANPRERKDPESKPLFFSSSGNDELIAILKEILSRLGEQAHFLQISSLTKMRARHPSTSLRTCALPLRSPRNFNFKNRISFTHELLKKFSELKPKKIVFLNPDELYIFKESYRIFDLTDEEKQIIDNCKDIFSYLNEKDFLIRRRFPGKYLLIDSCTLARGLKIKTPQRKILEKILEHPPLELAKDSFFNCLPDSFSKNKFDFPAASVEALSQEIRQNKCDGIITTCTTCFFPGDQTLGEFRKKIQFLNLLKLLNESMG